MATSDSVAGPSRPYFPIPFRLDASRETPTPRPFGPSRPSSRSSTPVRPVIRARSSSTFSTRTQADEDAALLNRKRADSVKKMVNSWELLREKYGSVGLNEDDDVNIWTLEITKSRGRVKRMEPRRDIGEDSDDAAAASEPEDIVDPDQDELGGWGKDSGLDPQTRKAPPQRIWTEQDQQDLNAFMRAEAERKALDGDDEDEGERWSSDEDGAQADVSETSSPDHSDYEAVSGSGDDSEDELLAYDDEAARKTPVPSRPRQECLDVMIPTRQKRVQPSSTTSSRKDASPQSLRNLFTPPPMPSPPPPGLSDLFTPAPEPASLTSPLPKPSVSNDKRRTLKLTLARAQTIDAPPIPLPSLSAAQKGKARMPSERPHESALPNAESSQATDIRPEDIEPPTDTRRYMQQLSRHTRHLTLRYCWICRTCPDDPQRRQWAFYCRGRSKVKNCVFARELGEETSYSKVFSDVPQSKRINLDQEGVLFRGLKSEGDLAGLAASTPKVTPPPRRKSLGAMSVRQSGTSEDEGARTAPLQPNRRRGRSRVESTINTAIEPTPIPSTPTRTPPEIKLPESQSTDSDTDSWMFSVLETLPTEMRGLSNEPLDLPPRKSKKARAVTLPAEGSGHDTDKSTMAAPGSRAGPKLCPLCRHAGGKREEEAGRCRGKDWSKRCPFAEPPLPTVEPEPEAVTSDLPSPPTPARLSPASLSPMPSRSLKKSARKRIITPISVSPAPDVFSDNRECDQTSLPPSSPPQSASPSRAIQPFSHPTPSPTVSAEPDKRENHNTPLCHPTSPLARRILPLPRGSHYAIHPTPPPSNVSRTSSLSSDRAAFERPRSILRAPPGSGSSTGSGPNSLKRARFSLRPSSPGMDSSDAFAQSDTESQDYEQESSSPWQGDGDLRHDQQTSSPFFSKELSVRAADAGFQLGLGHTGRITPGMMQALYPKYGGASVHNTSSPDSTRSTSTTPSKPYTLPTPPRLSSTPSRSVRSPSKPSAAGLMLPPPVPPKRLGSANSNTPGPPTPSRAPHDTTPPVKSPRTPNPRRSAAALPTPIIPHRPIIFRTALPAHVVHAQARARSRSVSATPVSGRSGAGSSAMARRSVVPATTPRKRYRDRTDRELARLAREIGDDAGLEWGMDEDVDPEIARDCREGTVFMYLE